jgi:hypothetical protein
MADGVASSYDVVRAKEDAEQKAQTLIAKMNARDYYDIRNRRWVQRHILERWVVQNYYDPSQMAKELERIAAYYHGDFPAPGGRGEFVYIDPFQDEEFMDGLRQRMDFQRSERMRVLEGNLQEFVRTINMVDIEKSFTDYSPKFYLKRLTGGKFMIISGDLGIGKSDLGCTFAGMAIAEEGRLVLSGIELMSDIEGYVYCRTFTRLLYQACKAKGEGRRVLLIIDEGGLEYPSYRSTATPMQILDRMSKLFRKLGIDWIFISQRETQVPNAFKMYNAVWFMKTKKTEMEMIVNDGRPSRKELITEVPRTKLPFDTDHISSLATDITVEEVLRFLESLPERTNQFAALRDYMEVYIANMNNPIPLPPNGLDISTVKKMKKKNPKEDVNYGETSKGGEADMSIDEAGSEEKNDEENR